MVRGETRACEFSVKKPDHAILTTVLILLLAHMLSACEALTFTPTIRPTPSAAYIDANDVVRGICFEAAFDSAKHGQIFILRDAETHIRFYELADNSQLCRHPVERVPFDFSNGWVLAGMWSTGVGCTAHHDVIDTVRDDRAKIFHIQLRFITEGDCPYELVRPFWIGISNASDYEITIEQP
jgi:hypothetical protein